MGTIHKFKGKNGDWAWEDVNLQEYGAAAPGITVQRFLSRRDNSNNMELRYFELQPGAQSNYEKHNYEHAVLILRGSGRVQLGEKQFDLQTGDTVFVESGEVHRFIAGGDGPFGFMCAVLDKELRFTVHGEQHLEIYDRETGEVKSKKHWKSYGDQV
jgi:quercetin dioxygenase-like cupin family protein